MDSIRDRNDRQKGATKIAIVSCAFVLAIASSGLLAGCNSASASVDRADYSATLNRYFEGRPTCLWQDSVTFPMESVSQGQALARGLDALVEAGMLTRRSSVKGAVAGAYTYDLTKEGYSALDRDIDHPSTGNFCYGHRTVMSVDADRHNSPTTELVHFRYHVAQPASWANEVAIQRTFPQVVDELSGPHTAEATLLDTDEGWEVSGNPVALPKPN